jgi:hypothetical protein
VEYRGKIKKRRKGKRESRRGKNQRIKGEKKGGSRKTKKD